MIEFLHTSRKMKGGNVATTGLCDAHCDERENYPCPWCRIAELERQRDDLLAALKRHRHTEECRAYSGRTAAQHGNHYCMAKCADSWRAAVKGGGPEASE